VGVIIRQGIKHSILNYLGTLIGAISILFIYPLNDELYGFAQWIAGTAFLLVPVATLGVHSLIVKYFPNFKHINKENSFNSLIGLLLVIFFTSFIILYQVFENSFLNLFTALKMNSEYLRKYKWIILTLLGLFVLRIWFRLQSTNYHRIVVPSLINLLGYKFFLPALILASLYVPIGLELGGWFVILFYGVALLSMLIYLLHIKAFRFGRITWDKELNLEVKEVASFSLFGSLNSLGSQLSFRVDSVMIPLLLDFFSNGVYNKILFMSNVIAIPASSISQISSPIISEAFKNNDLEKISDIYRRSSSNLFLIGSFIFLIIWFNIESIISFSSDPDSFPSILSILFILGIAKLIDMICSLNSLILIYSPYYKYNLAFLIFLASVNITLNYLWINAYGIIGAAMATFVAMLSFNTIKFIFIWIKLKMQPFSRETFNILVLFLICFCGLYLLPSIPNSILDIMLKGILTVSFYFVAVYYFKITGDSKNIVDQFLKKIKLIK